MTDPAPDPSPVPGSTARSARLRPRLPRRRRARIGLAAVVVVVLAIGLVLVLGRGGTPSTAGSPPLPSTYRPGSGIGPVSLGETLPSVVRALGGNGRQLVPGTLVFRRPGGQLAVGFARGRATRLLATGSGNPFGQRLAAEETTLSGWNVELCDKPARLLLVAPGGHAYFVFPTAAAGLGAVGVSTSPVTACGPLG
ncbi:MAG TPA: hypothetical protein VIJ51_19655 [Solirubrobacteraceae bacterium]